MPIDYSLYNKEDRGRTKLFIITSIMEREQCRICDIRSELKNKLIMRGIQEHFRQLKELGLIKHKRKPQGYCLKGKWKTAGFFIKVHETLKLNRRMAGEFFDFLIKISEEEASLYWQYVYTGATKKYKIGSKIALKLLSNHIVFRFEQNNKTKIILENSLKEAFLYKIKKTTSREERSILDFSIRYVLDDLSFTPKTNQTAIEWMKVLSIPYGKK
ncbi:MAG: hypothetical protein WC613_05860 [Candidatus Aenigmatarchaeota archaeon]